MYVTRVSYDFNVWLLLSFGQQFAKFYKLLQIIFQ